MNHQVIFQTSEIELHETSVTLQDKCCTHASTPVFAVASRFAAHSSRPSYHSPGMIMMRSPLRANTVVDVTFRDGVSQYKRNRSIDSFYSRHNLKNMLSYAIRDKCLHGFGAVPAAIPPR